MTPDTILTAVAEASGISVSSIVGKNKRHAVVMARWTVIHLFRTQLGLTLEAIGRILGGRDHTSIGYGLRFAESEPVVLALLRKVNLTISHNEEAFSPDIEVAGFLRGSRVIYFTKTNG